MGTNTFQPSRETQLNDVHLSVTTSVCQWDRYITTHFKKGCGILEIRQDLRQQLAEICT